jgi:RNA polymerase sigma factor (sigma-70 family)
MDKDKKLIRRIQNKSDKNAANELVSKYYREIYAYVYKQTMDKELSMDLTQEIFINILKSIYNYDERRASFRNWIYKIATYRLVDYYRSKSYKYNNMTIPIDDVHIFYDEGIEIEMEKKEDVEKVIGVLSNMDTLSQQIFRLKIFAGYTFTEISKILDMPESTVKTRYYSMIKRIRRNFEEERI